jgi:Zn-dependent protease
VSIYRVRAAINGVQGLPGLFTAYYDASAGMSAGDALTVASRVRAAWDVFKTSLTPAITVQVSPVVDVLQETTGDLVGSFAITPPALVTGTAAGAGAPNEVAAGLVYDTGVILGSRRLRGRSFLSPLSHTAVAGTIPPAGTVTNVNAMGVALITATPPAAVAPHVVWHRPKPGDPGQIFPTKSALCAAKFFVIRSRRD